MFSVRCLIALLLLALGAVSPRPGLRLSIITEEEQGKTEKQAKGAEDSKSAQDAEKNPEDVADDAQMVEEADAADDAEKANVVAHETSATEETLPWARQSWTDYARGLFWGAKDMAMNENIPGWIVHWDEQTGRPFYENKKIQLSYWDHPMKGSNPIKMSIAETAYWNAKTKKSEEETRRHLDQIAQFEREMEATDTQIQEAPQMETEMEFFQRRLGQYLDVMSKFVRNAESYEKRPGQKVKIAQAAGKICTGKLIGEASTLMQDAALNGVISRDMQIRFDSLGHQLELIVKIVFPEARSAGLRNGNGSSKELVVMPSLPEAAA